MDEKIKALAKFHKENPDVLGMIRRDCPSQYGLNDREGICGGEYCVICWEQALEAVHDE